MKRIYQHLAVFLASCVFLGCGQQAADSTTAAANPDGTKVDSAVEPGLGAVAREPLVDQQLPIGITQDTPPDQIVAAFLDALRIGDSSVAEALLTRRALEETRKRDLLIQHMGSPQATFNIGDPEYLNAEKNGVHVNTTWREQRENAMVSYDIVWALRRQDVGWRVAGMGAQLGPGQPAVYLNFEDPDDMLAKWRRADDDAARVADQAAESQFRQAQNSPDRGELQR